MSALSLAIYEATADGTRLKFRRAIQNGLGIVMERTKDDKTLSSTRAISETSLKMANGLDFLFVHMIHEMTDELDTVPKRTGRTTLRQFHEDQG